MEALVAIAAVVGLLEVFQHHGRMATVSEDAMTKYQLFALLAVHGTPTVTIKGVTGVLSAVMREDGSGSSFMVTLYTSNGIVHLHVTTID